MVVLRRSASFTIRMSSPDISKSHAGAIVIGTVVLVIVYFLMPPVIGSVLERIYGGFPCTPARVRHFVNMIYAPAEWLANHSESYKAVMMYEWRLLRRP